MLAFVSLLRYDSGLLFPEIRRDKLELDPFENGESGDNWISVDALDVSGTFFMEMFLKILPLIKFDIDGLIADEVC